MVEGDSFTTATVWARLVRNKALDLLCFCESYHVGHKLVEKHPVQVKPFLHPWSHESESIFGREMEKAVSVNFTFLLSN